MKRGNNLAILVLAILALGANPVRADERMNGMVGLWYGPYNGFSFEYDLIAQIFKSRNWMGNITGPFIMDEIGSESNRFGAGFAMGMRVDEKGTFAGTVAFIGQNKWDRFSQTDWGAEAKISIWIFGAKLGLIEDWKKLYWQVGLSY